MEENAKFNLVKLIYVVVAIVAIPVIFSQVVIRYFYTQWLEPQSTAGTVMMAEAVINKQLDPTKKIFSSLVIHVSAKDFLHLLPITVLIITSTILYLWGCQALLPEFGFTF